MTLPHGDLDGADRPARLAVGVVGAGRVGSVLGAALRRAGHEVVGVSAVSDDSLRRAERLLPGVPVLAPPDVFAAAGLVLLAVPDDVLPGLVEGLAKAGAVRPGQLLAHTSGRHGTTVLAPATRLGALPLALHPAMTFTGRSEDLDRLAGACFGVTAPDELRPVAEALVLEMGADPQHVDESARVLYHAALAQAANHLAALVNEAVDQLRSCGIAEPERLVAPLAGAALDNALRAGDQALTGPVARGDSGTVRAHLEALRSDSPRSVPAYVAMARLTALRALDAGLLPPAAAAELLDVLSDPRPEPPGPDHGPDSPEEPHA